MDAGSRAEPDEYDEDQVGLTFNFGRPESRLGGSVQFNEYSKEYTNNDAQTFERSYDESAIIGRVSYLIGAKTRMFVEHVDSDVEYDNLTAAGTTLDSNEESNYIGVTWEATDITTGSVKFGRLDKDFDAGGSEDLNVWEVEVVWTPRTYSTVRLNSSLEAQETFGTGAFIEATNHTLYWGHEWTDQISTFVNVAIGSDEFPGTDREDDRQNLGFGVRYNLGQYLNLGASYSYSERDSNDSQFDFQRNQIVLSLDTSL